ncbi:MAG: STAS domain-containing protein [bacterium]|nr:MAG: STAS domain-containing protein [bacterium]
MEFHFSKHLEDKVVVVEIPKYLSADISEEFKDFLYDIVEKGNHWIVIDLSEAEYVDSSGLGAIVSRLAYCRALKGDIRLAAPSEFMKSLLKITHLDQVLKVYPDTDAAISSFTD